MEIMEKEALTRIAKEKVKEKLPQILTLNLPNANRKVNTPSMLHIYCNIVELLRLRHELILNATETAAL